MKQIDLNVKYDLSNLSDAQLLQFSKQADKYKKKYQGSFCDLDWLKKFKNEYPFTFIENDIGFSEYSDFSNCINALTLFTSEKNTVIFDTDLKYLLDKYGNERLFELGVLLQEYAINNANETIKTSM